MNPRQNCYLYTEFIREHTAVTKDFLLVVVILIT